MRSTSTHPSHLVGWQETLLRTAHAARRAARAERSLPALDPGTVETVLDSLCSHGFSDEAAAAAYQAFSWFLLGHLVVETSPGLRGDGRAGQAGGPGSADIGAGAGFPTTARLAARLREDAADELFEVGLEQLLDRIGLYRLSVPSLVDVREGSALQG